MRPLTFGLFLGVWVAAVALRLGFLAFHLRDPDRLWQDYERGGHRFVLARWLDRLTWIAVLGAASWALSGLEAATAHRSGKVFVAWLGVSLLMRLPVHRFPRTNLPGAWNEAKAALITHFLVALAEALLATAAAAVYFWWRA